MEQEQKAAALYMRTAVATDQRLSQSDKMDGEDTVSRNNSIDNQRQLLREAVGKYGYSKLVEYVDDGVSGNTLKRPGFKRMEQDIENGKIAAVFVKDLSRLGRNYQQALYCADTLFPKHDVRLISIDNGVWETGEDMNAALAPMRSLQNMA